MKKFTEDIDLDAKLLFAGMKGGIDAVMSTAYLMRDKINADDVIPRCKWFKKQKKEYIDKVIELVIKQENK